MLKKHKSIFVILVSLFTILNLTAQSKIETIEGKVKKIIIETEKGKTTFENEDAEELFFKLKKNKESKIDLFYFDSDELEKKDSLTFKKGANKVIVLKGKSDFKDEEENLEIKINEGEMKIIEITNVNGETKEKVYTGEEAKKYLEGKKENAEWIDVDESKIIISTNKDKKVKEKKVKVIIEKKEKKKED